MGFAEVWDNTTSTVPECASSRTHVEIVAAYSRRMELTERQRKYLRGLGHALNPVLLSPDGPFASCTPDRHSEPAPLVIAAPPAGYWTQLDT